MYIATPRYSPEDALERAKNTEDFPRATTGLSALHVLTIATTGASIAIYVSGR